MMVKNDMSPVAQQRVWEEHLVKEARQQSKFRSASDEVPFSINPQSLKSKTLPEVKINRREARFLDRERAALAAIQRQLAARTAASAAPAINTASALPTLTSPTRGSASATRRADATLESLPPLQTRQVDKATLEKMALVHQGPKAKYAFPQTEAQELGWLSKPLVRPDTLFHHGLKSCDVTAFANFAVSRNS